MGHHHFILICFLSFLCFSNCQKKVVKTIKPRAYIEPYNRTELQKKYGGDLHKAIKDMVKGMPTNKLTVVCDKSVDYDFVNVLLQHLSHFHITLQIYNITLPTGQNELQNYPVFCDFPQQIHLKLDLLNLLRYLSYMTSAYKNFHAVHSLFFVNQKLAEHILIDIYEYNLIRRNLVYVFYWGTNAMYRYFLRNMHETMRIAVVTNPRMNAYRIYYNQATSHRLHHLEMVNWWIDNRGLFQHPTLPPAKKIFRDFKQRLIYIPVIHKPPWHFVQYNNDSISVLGGRDDGLIKLLAARLNFKFIYYDPPERIQGTSFSANGSFEGVIGQLWRREAEFFIGDVALTIDRAKVAEFSFFTLADSGAFISHTPSKLNEAFALVRPFHWRVWPAIVVTVAISGPILYFLIITPNFWRPRFKVRNQKRFMIDVTWYTIGIFLKQAASAPSQSHKARFIIIILSICATYVIGGIYAAMLTSMLAYPGREKPITNLPQLAEAMKLKNYNLLVESHSSSYSLLENGTGIYGVLWDMMTKNQKSHLVESVEQGVQIVRDSTDTVLMAGRETLFFDIQRFGTNKFHLSLKLNTAYSAIALQIGCPFLDNFNRVLMGIFEAGILTKMTEDEYRNLGKRKRTPINVQSTSISRKDMATNQTMDNKAKDAVQSQQTTQIPIDEDENQLKPISTKMLQGAFYLLGFGYIVAGLTVVLEMINHKHHKQYKKLKKEKMQSVRKLKNSIVHGFRRMHFYIYRKYRLLMNEAIVATLDYVE